MWRHLPECVLQAAVGVRVSEVDVECDVRLLAVGEVQTDGVVEVPSEGDVVHGPHVPAVTGVNRLPPAEATGGLPRLGWQVDGHHPEGQRIT